MTSYIFELTAAGGFMVFSCTECMKVVTNEHFICAWVPEDKNWQVNCFECKRGKVFDIMESNVRRAMEDRDFNGPLHKLLYGTEEIPKNNLELLDKFLSKMPAFPYVKHSFIESFCRSGLSDV